MSAHAEFLRVATGDDELAAGVKRDWRTAGLGPRERALAQFVDTLTRWPAELCRSDFVSLAAHGFDASGALRVVLGCAHFNYLNRMADALGIRFEYETELPAFDLAAAPPPEHRAAPSARDAGAAGAWIELPQSPAPSLAAHEPVRLFHVLGHVADVRDGVRAWRAYQLAGTERFDESLRARLALYCSALVSAAYCVSWLARRAAAYGVPAAEIERLAAGERPAKLTARDARLFEHARRITLEPWLHREEHVQTLRDLGLDDRDVVRFAMLVAYLSFEVRVALGLGLTLEEA